MSTAMPRRARAIDERQLAFGFGSVVATAAHDDTREAPVVAIATPHRGARPPRAVDDEALPGLARPRTKLLEEAIRRGLGPTAKVLITDNKSTLISRTKKGADWTVRIHQMFLEGGAPLFDDIGRWLGRGDAEAGRRIDAYIARRDHLLDHHARPLDDDAGRGEVHDLVAIMARVNAAHFDPPVRAEITWGQGVRRGRRSTITLGTYDERARRITIHAALDQPFVPEVAVARVVHHEMLHAIFPPVRGVDGRRVVHGDAFREAEARFVGAKDADRWLDGHIDVLLGQRRGAKRTEARAWQFDDDEAVSS